MYDQDLLDPLFDEDFETSKQPASPLKWPFLAWSFCDSLQYHQLPVTLPSPSVVFLRTQVWFLRALTRFASPSAQSFHLLVWGFGQSTRPVRRCARGSPDPLAEALSFLPVECLVGR